MICPPNINSTGALDRRAVFGLMQIMERERTAYEYQQEGSVRYYWYDASFKNTCICNQPQNHIMCMLRIHVGRNGSLTDHKIPRCCEATRMHYAEKSNEKSNGYFSY